MIIYAVRRWLGMTPAEWDDTPWDIQQAYLDGLDQDEDIPFSRNSDASGAFGEGEMGPTVRTGVDAGTAVIDLAAMRAELEADPRSRRQW